MIPGRRQWSDEHVQGQSSIRMPNRERKQRRPHAVNLRTAHVMRQGEGGLHQNGLEWPNTLHYENTCNNDRIDSVLSFQMLTRKDEW